jgi:hypothetical protein
MMRSNVSVLAAAHGAVLAAALGAMLAVAIAAQLALAGLPLVADGEIPERLTAAELDGIHIFTRVSLDEQRFDGFSLGGSDDLPPAEADRLRGLVAGLSPDQWLFVQATADTTRWHGRRAKENHRLDVMVALARALWGEETLDHERRITVLPPRLGASRRGLTVFLATYDESVVPFPAAQPAAAPTPAPAPPPPQVVVREGEAPSFTIGLEGGVGTLSTSGVSMTTPTVDFVIEKAQVDAEVRLDVGVGWWPAGDNEFGELADGTAKTTLSWFPHGGWIGPFIGWAGGSQFVRSVTEYVVFAHGPAAGVTVRSRSWLLDGALRLGYARVNLDEFNREQRWANALVLSAQVGKVF